MQQTNKLLVNGAGAVPVPQISPTYLLNIEGDHTPPIQDGQYLITAGSIEEAAHIRSLLGESCEMRLSDDYRREHPESDRRIMEITAAGNGNTAPFDTESGAELLRKLPLDLKRLAPSPIGLTEGEELPRPISKSLVHKKVDSNILISEPFSTGWVLHFNMFLETGEMRFDHESGHVQGMLLLEALRQTGIATGHLQGLPLDGQIALLSYDTRFFHFVERTAPIVIRAYSGFTADENSEDKEIKVFAQVIQWGKPCAEAMLNGFACINQERCLHKEKRIEKIAERNKTLFFSKFRQSTATQNAGR